MTSLPSCSAQGLRDLALERLVGRAGQGDAGAHPVELDVEQRRGTPGRSRAAAACRPRFTSAWRNSTNSRGAPWSAAPSSRAFSAFGTRGDMRTACTAGVVSTARGHRVDQLRVRDRLPAPLAEVEQRLGVVAGDRLRPHRRASSVAR